MVHAEVLMIEDSAADRFWLEYVLRNATSTKCAFSSVEDGEQAVNFLLKRGEFTNAPTPDVIFLDAHLPKLDGIEVLRAVRNAERLPVCVVTSSEGCRVVGSAADRYRHTSHRNESASG